MIFTGLLSVLQILFLPGLILNVFIRKEAGIIYRVSFIIAFSMLFNFVFIVILVMLHAFVFSILLITALIELVIILIIYRKIFSQSIGQIFNATLSKFKVTIKQYLNFENAQYVSKNIYKVIKIIALFLAFLTLGWILVDFLKQIGTIFSWWDSVLSYNRWAIEWSRGIFPTGACEYPQLLPTNWSLTYVFTQSSIGIFAKLVQGVFPILFILALIDLGLTLGSAGFLFSVPISTIILKKFVGVSLFEGYMDLAVTTFILLSFYMILKDLYNNRYSQKTLWLSGVVILAATMTKQPGLIAFGAWVMINFFLILFKNQEEIWASMKKMFIPTLIYLIIIASWYIFKMSRDAIVGESSCFAITNSWAINDLNSGFWNILLYRLKLLDHWILLIPMLFIAIFFAKGGVKLILLCFGIPYLILGLSYGLPNGFVRYLTPLTFIFTFSMSVLIDLVINILLQLKNKFSIKNFLTWIGKNCMLVTSLIQRLSRNSFWWILIFAITIIALFGLNYPDSKLIRNNHYHQMGIGNRVINNYIYDFYMDKDAKDLTLTWYPYINYLPGLEGRSIFIFGGSIESVSDYLIQENIKFVLVYYLTPSEIANYFVDLVEKGQLELITDFGSVDGAILYEIIR